MENSTSPKAGGPGTAGTSPETDGPVCVSRKEARSGFLKESGFLQDGHCKIYPNWNVEPGCLEDSAIPTFLCEKCDLENPPKRRKGSQL